MKVTLPLAVLLSTLMLSSCGIFDSAGFQVTNKCNVTVKVQYGYYWSDDEDDDELSNSFLNSNMPDEYYDYGALTLKKDETESVTLNGEDGADVTIKAYFNERSADYSQYIGCFDDNDIIIRPEDFY